LKVVLITPYTGGNLGDAAIQEAVISNVRRRDANAEIVLVTLAPEITARLHGVQGFPIGVTTFGPGFELPGPDHASLPSRVGLLSRMMAVAKRWRLLRVLWRATREMSRRVMWMTGLSEARHITRAFRVARGSSVVVISGGGQLDDYWGGPLRQPYAILKWGLLAKVVGARFVFLSVGHCSLRPFSRLLVHSALRIADYRSFRDRGSKDLLAALPWTQEDPVSPDLAFSYERRGGRSHAGAGPHRTVVGLSPIAYLSRYGWPDQKPEVYDNYVRRLLDFVADLIRRDFAIVLFSSDAADRPVIDEFLDRLTGQAESGALDRVARRSTLTLDELIPEVDAVDYVVASRLHGVILSHLLAKPTVAISYDRKVDTHMVDMGMADYCIDIHTLQSTSLINAFTSLMTNGQAIRSRLRASCARQAVALQRQYDHVWTRVVRQPDGRTA
jgi:polysaccharide pyruvyl transferase WcaK-like protein